MLNWLKSYFSFTKKELNGILVLVTLIVVVAVIPSVYSMLRKEKAYDFTEYAAEIDRFYASEKKYPAHSYKELREEIEDKELVASYFVFDPNGLSEADWQKLGMSARQIKVIKNYEAKGGRFYRKEDLRKIYSISAQKYAMLEPYIKIKDQRKSFAYGDNARSAETRSFKKPPIMVEINTADSSQLEALKGIGPAFALRIVKYRQRLGGFHSVEQLREVYGIDSAKFDQFKDQVVVHSEGVTKININQAGFEDLKRHPYLSYKQMNAILQYRRQHGPYGSIDDLRKIKILNDEILSKIAPYFSF